MVDFSEVVAVEVENIEMIAPYISEGRITRVPGEKIPSKLEIARNIKQAFAKPEIGEEIKLEVRWGSFKDDAVSYLNVQDILIVLNNALKDLCIDDLGKSAVRSLDSIDIQHSDSENMDMKIGNNILLISIDLTSLLPKNLGKFFTQQFNAVF